MWRNRRDDRGFTLTEMLVSVAITGIVMVIVTGAVLQASATSARVDAASSSQQQAHQAFDKLDRLVRWASGYSTPARAPDGNDYVEWLQTAGGTPTCQELRLDRGTRQLQLRSWAQDRIATTVTRWRVIASGVGAVDAATPVFTRSAADSTFGLSRLRIAVTATAGGTKLRDSTTHDVTYTAANSTGATVPDTVCTEGRTRP
ncbi:PulJ/GspJ family protein [Jatrophihabitans sp. YIM 134969]